MWCERRTTIAPAREEWPALCRWSPSILKRLTGYWGTFSITPRDPQGLYVVWFPRVDLEKVNRFILMSRWSTGKREREGERGRKRGTDRKRDRATEREPEKEGETERERERERERIVCNWAALCDKQTESIERLNKMRERWPGRDGCRQDESTAAVSRVSEDTGKYGSPAAQKVNPPCLRHWRCPGERLNGDKRWVVIKL